MSDDAAARDAQVDSDLDAAFNNLATGQFPASNEPKDLPENADTAAMESEAQVAELQARLSVSEQNYTVALKERDAAEEARKKLEKTLAEFLARFASLRDTQAAAFREMNKLKTERRDLEKKVADVSAQLTDTQKARDEAAAALNSERAAATAARQDLEKFREAALSALEPLGREHERAMKSLMAETDTLLTQTQAVRAQATQRLDELEHTLAEFKTRANTTRKELAERLALVLGGAADKTSTKMSVLPETPETKQP